MKIYILKLIISFVLLSIGTTDVLAQSSHADSNFVQAATGNIINNFNKAIGQQSRLFNGHEYLPYDPVIKNNALYPPDANLWLTGQVNYDGIEYKNVSMKYDIYKDVVVVLLYNQFSQFVLLSNKVNNFDLANHHFIRLDPDSSKINEGLTSGFYDELYSGKIKILAKRSKSIQNSSNTTAFLETYFVAKNQYFLQKGNNFYSISSESSTLNALKDKKKDLQKYLKDNKIKFRESPEATMVQLAAYYDHLSN